MIDPAVHNQNLVRAAVAVAAVAAAAKATEFLPCLGTSFASGHMARMPVLLTALVSTLANLFLLEPVTTSVMYKIYDMENTDRKQTDEYKAARKKFGGLHGASSLVNLVGMVCAIMHCYALSVAMA